MTRFIAETFRDLGSDVRFACRMMHRHPVHAVASVLTLALGIGATTSVFAVVDATLLRPLAYKAPDRLVGLNAMMPGPDGRLTPYSLTQIEHLRWHAARAFEYIESIEPRTMALTGAGDPEVIRGGLASSALFRMLGVDPKLGRTYTAEEEQSNAAVAVLSDGLWRRRFSGESSALGRTLTLDGRTFEVIGVMPGGFRALFEGSDVWVPLRPIVDPSRAGNRLMTTAGRLRPGINVAQAQAELVPISQALGREFPITNAQVTPQVIPLREQLYGQRRTTVVAILMAVLLLFVLACVNVVNLTYGHVASRRSEFLVREALGGGRWRLVRLQLVQSGLIAGAGGVLGLWIMQAVLPGVLALNAASGLTPILASIDGRVAAFGGALVIMATALSGALPAMQAHGASFAGAVARVSSGRVRGGRADRRTRAVLVVTQIALAFVLLCGAGVFVMSLQRLLRTSPGFSPENVLSMQLTLAPARYPDVNARANLVERALDRINQIPSVIASGTTQTTFLPNQSMQTLLFVDGVPIDPARAETAHMRHITPGYFKALRVPVVEGRPFDERDRIGTPGVCMVSARFAKQFWPNGSAIGHQVKRGGSNASWLTIIGVVGDVMDAGLGVQQGPTLYVNYLQINTATARVSLLVRLSGDPLGAVKAVQQAVWSIDPGQPMDRVGRLQDVLVETTSDQQFQTTLLSGFAVVGLVLAVIGVYGVTAAAVKARTWEAGVRMALGASSSRVLGEMLHESGMRVLMGIGIGAAVFLAAGRLASSLLYNTSYADPRVIAAAVILLSGMSMVVIYTQARRLASVSPVLALREDTSSQ
jgi:putative ABC transport system permease protein